MSSFRLLTQAAGLASMLEPAALTSSSSIHRPTHLSFTSVPSSSLPLHTSSFVRLFTTARQDSTPSSSSSSSSSESLAFESLSNAPFTPTAGRTKRQQHRQQQQKQEHHHEHAKLPSFTPKALDSSPQKITVPRESRIQTVLDEIKEIAGAGRFVDATEAQRLDKECHQLLAFLRPRHIASYLFRRTKISECLPTTELLVSLERRGIQISPDFDAQSIVMVLQGLSRMPNFATSEEYLRALERRSTEIVSDFSSQDISLCLDAFSAFFASQYHLPSSEYFPVVEQKALELVSRSTSKDIALTLGAMAKMGKHFRPSKDFLKAFEKRALATIRQFNHEDITHSLAATLTFDDGAFTRNFFFQIERQMIECMNDFPAPELSVSLAAFAKMQIRVGGDFIRAAKSRFLGVVALADGPLIYRILASLQSLDARFSRDDLEVLQRRVDELHQEAERFEGLPIPAPPELDPELLNFNFDKP